MAPAWAEQRAGHLTIRRPGHQKPKGASSDTPISRRELSTLMGKGTGKGQGTQGSGSITKVG